MNDSLEWALEQDAADELARRRDVNQPPVPIGAVHRFAVRFAEEMDSYGIRLGEVFQAGGIFAILLIVKPNGANVLVAAPNGLLLAQALVKEMV